MDVAGSLTSIAGLTDNGTLNVNGAGTLSGDLTNNGSLAFNVSDTQTYAGDISGTGSVTMDGSGTEVLSGQNGGFYGTTTVLAGILEAASPDAFPGEIAPGGVASGATFAIGAGGFGSSAYTEIAALIASGDFAPGANLGIDVGSGSFDYDNFSYPPISDPGPDSPLGLVVLGSGVFVVDGSNPNDYSGGTTIVGATLELNNPAGLGASGGSLTVNGGNVDLETNSVVLGSVNVTGGGSILDGSLAASSCSLSGNSSVTVTGGSNTLGVVTVENGSSITGSYSADSQTLLADDGGSDDVSGIPAGWDLFVTNGTTADLAPPRTLSARSP